MDRPAALAPTEFEGLLALRLTDAIEDCALPTRWPRENENDDDVAGETFGGASVGETAVDTGDILEAILWPPNLKSFSVRVAGSCSLLSKDG